MNQTWNLEREGDSNWKKREKWGIELDILYMEKHVWNKFYDCH